MLGIALGSDHRYSFVVKFAVVFSFSVFPFPPSEAKLIGDFSIRRNAGQFFI
jgi:hypothetical protein